MTEDGGLPEPRRRLSMACLLTAIAMAVIDGTVVNVALPTIARHLAVPPEQAIWVVTAYQIALVVSLLAFASLGEIVGYRRIFRAGLMLFIIALFACAASRSLALLLVARAAQGFACAAMFGVSSALLRLTQPPARLGQMIGSVALLVAVSMAAAPSLGALVLAVADWWWIFLLNVPVGLVALALSGALPQAVPDRRRFDWISAVLNALVLGLLTIGLGGLAGAPAWSAGAIAVAVAAGAVLVRRQLAETAPLVPFDLLRIRAFAAAVAASTCCFAAQTCAFVALPFHLQNDLGLGELETGLLLTAWPVAVACTAPVAGRLSDRLPAALLCGAGAVLLAAGLAWLAVSPPAAPIAALLLATAAAGVGFGVFQTPNNRAMLMAAPVARSGAAGGMQATARQFGQAAGAALVALAFTAPRQEAQLAFLIGAGLAAVAAGTSFLRPR